MKLLTLQLIQELLETKEDICLSLYMPTHRTHPENLKDVIQFKVLVKELEKSLLLKYSTEQTRKQLEPFEALADDSDFWNHALEGLAVFSTSNYTEIIGLKVPVAQLAIVADSFHTKPLRQYIQSLERYHVLALSLHEFKLYEGNKHSLSEIDMPESIPDTITEALGEELTEKHLTVASYGGAGGESSGMRHGHGGKKEEVDLDAERFFRVVASSVNDVFSKPTGLPVILAALPEHHHLFYQVNKNPNIFPLGIPINPSGVSLERLQNLAWEIMEPEVELKLKNIVDKFQKAKAKGLGSEDLKEAAKAAVEGRIDTLLVEADRVIPVRITNLITGNTQKKDLENPKVDDLLDDMGELVIKMGGQVVVLPQEKMPTDTGLAAVLRY